MNLMWRTDLLLLDLLGKHCQDQNVMVLAKETTVTRICDGLFAAQLFLEIEIVLPM